MNDAPVSAFIVGDPLRLAQAPSRIADLLDVAATTPARATVLAPGVAVVHAVASPGAPITFRWITLERASPVAGIEEPVEAIVCSSAPRAQGAILVRLVEELALALADPDVVRRAREATTREAVVSVLSPAVRPAGAPGLPTPVLLALLDTTEAGLSAVEAKRRLAECGANRLQRVARRSLAARLGAQFVSFFALLLLFGGGLAFLARLPELGFAIVAVVVVNGVFSFFQEYRAERAVAALEALLPQAIGVVRDGRLHRVPVAVIVPGDVVQLEEGDQVPADGRLLAGGGLRVDQSALTGESRPRFKVPASRHDGTASPYERPECLYAGTAVVAGQGSCAVVATGMTTQIGAIARLSQTVREQPSPLQREMAAVTRVVTVIALGLGLGFFVVGTARGRCLSRTGSCSRSASSSPTCRRGSCPRSPWPSRWRRSAWPARNVS